MISKISVFTKQRFGESDLGLFQMKVSSSSESWTRPEPYEGGQEPK